MFEKAITMVQKLHYPNLELSILEKIDPPCHENVPGEYFENYWKHVLGGDTPYGLFRNPKMGSIFVAGPATKTFLQELGDENIGSLAEGPYAVFRALGIGAVKSKKLIDQLDHCDYLLIVRALKSAVLSLNNLLDKLDDYPDI